MKYVIIVNGRPESGKTTFEHYCRDYIKANEYGYVHIISSIDPIKEIYEQLGWNGNKGSMERKHLSDLKKIWVESCNGPIKYLANYIMQLRDNGDSFIFTDIREESEIIKFIEILNALSILDIKCESVLLNRKYIEGIEYGNKSDDDVGNNKSIYNTVINNNGNLDELRDCANIFVEDLYK